MLHATNGMPCRFPSLQCSCKAALLYGIQLVLSGRSVHFTLLWPGISGLLPCYHLSLHMCEAMCCCITAVKCCIAAGLQNFALSADSLCKSVADQDPTWPHNNNQPARQRQQLSVGYPRLLPGLTAVFQDFKGSDGIAASLYCISVCKGVRELMGKLEHLAGKSTSLEESLSASWEPLHYGSPISYHSQANQEHFSHKAMS